MKTKTQHTPTPWSIEQDEDDGSWFIWAKGNMVAKIPQREDDVDHANAAFIVRAVNSHEALLEAAREAQVALHAFLKNTNMLKLPDDSPLGVVWRKLEKAIAQTEGK